MPLTDAAVRDAQPGAKPKGLFDSNGLYLLVTPAGGRWWRFKYRYASKSKLLSLGTYPEVTLKRAREQRDEFRRLLADGLDPSECRKAERQSDQEARARQIAAMRFSLDDKGALSIGLGSRRINLTPAETNDLRVFLAATKTVADRREEPCR